MADNELSDETTATGQDSLLDALGALREQRAAETTTDLPLPGFAGRLWATFRLPARPTRAAQLTALIVGDQSSALGECLALLAECTVGLYTGSPDAEAPIRRDGGALAPGFQHLPGGTDELPINFNDGRLERIAQLCPARPAGKAHDPRTRVRTFFAGDALVIQAATMVCGWLGGEGGNGAIADLSDRFRAGDQRE